jgi:hypothetical protein
MTLPIVAAQGESADTLYADRRNLASAKRAADLWSADMVSDPRAVAPAWKLARVCYWLGTHAPERERRGYLDRGIAAGRQAVTLSPDAPEGHFWIAANMGSLAESFGLRAGLRYRKSIKEELETVLRLSPSFMQGSADRALGRWYFKVPGLFGGSHTRAIEHLRASLTYNPHSTVSLYFLAEVLLDDGKKAEGRTTLQQVIDAPFDPEWEPEDQEYKAKARSLLATLR